MNIALDRAVAIGFALGSVVFLGSFTGAVARLPAALESGSGARFQALFALSCLVLAISGGMAARESWTGRGMTPNPVLIFGIALVGLFVLVVSAWG